MKKLFLFLAFFLSAATMFADDISVQQALQIASQFATNKPTTQSKMRKVAAAVPNPSLAYAVKSDVSDKDNVYVINYGNDMGFVVVSGESGTGDEILGYCDHGAFDYANCPPQMKEVLDFYSLSIDTLRKNPELAAKRRVAQTWPSSIGTIIVEPLLTTQWSQWAPYNNLCPTGCPTGCVPTAVAQIMKYWRWPDVTREKVSGEDFSGRTYDWDNMIDNYETTSYTGEQAEAVAHLMADVGKALGTMYAPEGSGTGTDFMPLVYNFKYNRGNAYHENLAEEMKAELNQSRPLLYSARQIAYENGHELVVDGYTSKDYFHFNYGWGGSYDGFYKYAPLYNVAPSIITGIYPEDTDIIKLNDIKYMLYKNGTATIIGYFPEGINEDDDIMVLVKRENGAVVIPSNVEYNGRTYKVTRICQRAFYNKGHFTKITLGDNIEAIDHFAFINSTIDELVLSDKMEVVPDGAFETIKIKKLTIGKNIKRIGKRAFYMGLLSEVTSKSPAFEADDEAFYMTNPDCGEWLDCITSIGYQTFAGAGFSKSPIFSNVEKIGARAFNGVTFPEEVDGAVSVRQFHIKSKLKSIDPNAFYNTRLSIFKVDESNPYFSTSNFSLFARCMLFNKNATSLVLTIDPGTSIGEENGYMTAFPETVVRLEPSSISTRSKKNYVSVTIPNTVIDMEGAFKDCEYVNKLTCLAIVPPEISDSTFNDKLIESSPRLYVPVGTAELYRNAPGWRRFKNIVADQAYNPAPPQGRQYHMVVSSMDEEKQQRVNIPVSEIRSMEVSDDGSQVIIKRNGKEDLTTSIAAIDSIAWVPGFVYENAEIFDINEDNLTVEAQKCKIRFDPTVIDGDVQLCVRNSVMEGVVDGFAIDLSLSDDSHELTGTVDITIPVSDTSKKYSAAYYNEETGEWEPVYHEFDKTAGTFTITTNHLSTYGFFEIANEMLSYATLTPAAIDFMESLIPEPLNKMAGKLLEVIASDDPEWEMRWQATNDMGLWQSIGLDVLYSAANGTLESVLGYKPFAEQIDDAVVSMGYLATAMNVLNVARADLKGDDIGVASSTLKTILGHYGGVAGQFIGTTAFTASMATVAAIGIALEKFGTMVQQRKIDLYNEAYEIYYSPIRSKEVVAGTSKYGDKWCYTLKDWFDLFYKAFSNPDKTQIQVDSYVETVVRDYCNRFWEDTDAQAMCVAEAKAHGLTSMMYPDAYTRKTISDAYFAELMNGNLVSVIQSVRNHVKVDAFNRYSAEAKSLAKLMNTQIGLQILDKSVKEGEKSKYADHTIRFTLIPRSLSDPENFEKTINEQGRCKIGYFTQYALIVHDIPTRLTLIDPNGKEVADYPFNISNKKGKQIIEIDLSTGGVEVENPHLKGLELAYDPAEVDATYDWYGYFDGKYMRVGGIGMPIPLNNTFNKRANFQLAVEKLLNRHNFITVDASGNFKIGDDITGQFENNGLEGTAKFVIDTNNQFVEKTKEQFIKDFNSTGQKDDILTLYNLLNGTINHKIEGEVKITRESVNAKEYDVTYTGSGTYSFEAEVVDRVDNYQYEGLLKEQNLTSDDFTTRSVEQEGKVTLKYSTKITP
ncbi:MAG: C10 family peptidase [Prevotella sp.]|nr:C10 family peptidase [Prevotella sp.]